LHPQSVSGSGFKAHRVCCFATPPFSRGIHIAKKVCESLLLLKNYCKGGLPVNAQETADIRVFKETLGKVMQVSKKDLKELLAKEKVANADKPKRGPKPKS
jgi:hypothetical protein